MNLRFITKRVLLGMIIVIPLLFSAHVAFADSGWATYDAIGYGGPDPVSSCGILQTSGTYVLQGSITMAAATTSPCFIISADNITITTLGGALFNASTTGGTIARYAVVATDSTANGGSGYTNLTIQNLTFLGWSSGGVNTTGNAGTGGVSGGNGGAVTVATSTMGVISTSGGIGNSTGSLGGNGGAVVITNSTTGAVTTSGGAGYWIANNNGSNGGAAGAVVVAASSTVGAITANGGAGGAETNPGSNTSGAGGAGGAVTVTSSTAGAISANGGSCTSLYGTGGAGGITGVITITSSNIGSVTATGGSGGSGVLDDGIGGDVQPISIYTSTSTGSISATGAVVELTLVVAVAEMVVMEELLAYIILRLQLRCRPQAVKAVAPALC